MCWICILGERLNYVISTKMADQREPSNSNCKLGTEPLCYDAVPRKGSQSQWHPVHINHQAGDSPPRIPCQQGADSWWSLSGSCPAKPRHADAAEPEALQPSAIQDTPSTSCMGLGAWLEFNNCGKYGISPRVCTSTIAVTVVIKGSKVPTIAERTKQSM